MGVYKDVQRFRGGLELKAHRLLCHPTLDLRVINKKKAGGPLVRLKPNLRVFNYFCILVYFVICDSG